MSAEPSPVVLHVDPRALLPLIRATVAEVLAQLEAERQQLPADKFCWSEEEAARLLGLQAHQLRDERRRRRIGASSIVGRRIRYTRQDLVAYLAARRIDTE